MLNKIILEGRITRDYELKRTKTGKAITTICLAVNRDYKDQNKETPCDFFDCILMDRNAETASKFVGKGDRVIIVGRLQKRKWINKDGDTRWSTEVLTDTIYFSGNKKENEDCYNSPFEEDTDNGELPW